MTRDNLLAIAKPIPFREDMVRAIKFRKKTATRRLIKPQPDYFINCVMGDPLPIKENLYAAVDKTGKELFIKPRYLNGDILSVQDDIFLRVLNVRAQRVEGITEDEAIDEGFSSRAEFLGEFFEIYPEADLRSWVFAYEFELLEVDST